MSKIISIGTSLPKHIITQKQAKEFANMMFQEHYKDIHRLLKIFESTNISKRHFCVPLEWFRQDHSFQEKNTIYVKNAIELGKEALLNALRTTPFQTVDIDHIIFVSSTGISTPSIDAYLFNDPEIRFKENLKRTPIWGLGCAGGAAGVSRAFEYTKAFPNELVLVIALEIGELAFLKNDMSKSNLIATSLFADGAAAVLVAGDQVQVNTSNALNLNILSTYSKIWGNTLDIMGWDVQNDGFKVIFSKDIPTLITKELKTVVTYFLKENGLHLDDIHFFVLHPGGTKVLEAYQEAFHIHEEKLSISKGVLQQYGNMSSPTVLFVLKEAIEFCESKSGFGLMLALGPGFSAEILLLEWR